MGPDQVPPSVGQRGVGEHPHRGFETVTIAYHGKVAHRDSTGSSGVIGPGDAVTAASGVVHEELHEGIRAAGWVAGRRSAVGEFAEGLQNDDATVPDAGEGRHPGGGSRRREPDSFGSSPARFAA
ncbi:MAG: pirin family protein [Nitrospira sp.]|nr:pirin family protein [Nitrospira sp.]